VILNDYVSESQGKFPSDLALSLFAMSRVGVVVGNIPRKHHKKHSSLSYQLSIAGINLWLS
jgi:hypothetical protein